MTSLLLQVFLSPLVPHASAFTYQPPPPTVHSNLTLALSGTTLNNLLYSSTFSGSALYNYCHMPSASSATYPAAPAGHSLLSAEVVHRHHKRTPYASNLPPTEPSAWDCSDVRFHVYQQPGAAEGWWRVYDEATNPMRGKGTGWRGDCQFPQITAGGLRDARAHGQRLRGAYGELARRGGLAVRVTNNVITSQTAGAVVAGLTGAERREVPLLVQYAEVDTLAPGYACPRADAFRAAVTTGNDEWRSHLAEASPLFGRLDAVFGVPPGDSAWHVSFDHYLDTITSRICNGAPLPPQLAQEDLNAVLRLGQWEYAHMYRFAGKDTLEYARRRMGGFLVELRSRLKGGDAKGLRLNVAHDGSVSLLLSALQLGGEVGMVWPGLGAEITFERWRDGDGKQFVRVLWGGREMDWALGKGMVELDKVVDYIDDLVGDVVANCG